MEFLLSARRPCAILLFLFFPPEPLWCDVIFYTHTHQSCAESVCCSRVGARSQRVLEELGKGRKGGEKHLKWTQRAGKRECEYLQNAN